MSRDKYLQLGSETDTTVEQTKRATQEPRPIHPACFSSYLAFFLDPNAEAATMPHLYNDSLWRDPVPGPDRGRQLIIRLSGATSAPHVAGLKLATTAGSVSIRPAPIRSRQYGIAGKTASRDIFIAAGLPGRLRKNVLPRVPAV